MNHHKPIPVGARARGPTPKDNRRQKTKAHRLRYRLLSVSASVGFRMQRGGERHG